MTNKYVWIINADHKTSHQQWNSIKHKTTSCSTVSTANIGESGDPMIHSGWKLETNI